MARPDGHIIMCGYTPSAQAALAELQDEAEEVGITVLSMREVPEMKGVRHLRLNYLNVEHLRDRRVGLKSCSICVVFAEPTSDAQQARTVDMQTVLAVYSIKKERPDLPIIVEVADRANTSFIDELECNDVIYKETIDRNLITSCILHPNISPIFYDLLTVRGKQLRSTTSADLGYTEPVSYRDIRLRGLEMDVTFLGFIDPEGPVQLMPPNDTAIVPRYQLVYIE
jgi:hypothetical protein